MRPFPKLGSAGLVLLFLAGIHPDARGQDLPASEEPLILPPVSERELKEARLDTESYEIGLAAGVYSLSGFGTTYVGGLRGTYHLNEDILFEGSVGAGRVDQETFENTTGLSLVENENLIYWNIGAGYNLFPGQIFASRSRTVYSTLFVIGAVGHTRLDQTNHFTFTVGAGYKFFLTDWLDVRIDFRDHMFQTEITGSDKLTHNLENTVGLSLFF